MNSTAKTLLLWVAIVLVAVAAFSRFHSANQDVETVQFSRHLQDVRDRKVAKVEVKANGQEIEGRFINEKKFKTIKPREYDDYYSTLAEFKVQYEIEEPKNNQFIAGLFTYGPLLILLVLWIVFMRQMQSGGNRALSFGKSEGQAAVEPRATARSPSRTSPGSTEVPEARRQASPRASS